MLEPTSNNLLVEHQSDTQLITVKLEILLEPTSNKLLVEHAKFNESNTYVFERFDTSAGNPVKEILLKLNLPDHRSILTDSKIYIKMVMERRSVKVKELQERCTIKAFQVYKSRKALDRSEAHIKALEEWIAVLETQVYCHEWQRPDTDDCATRHIMRIQALEAGARVDTLEDTSSSA
ncbi:hypothetical protein Tco_0047388 [Tanacetum coccineum]